MPPSRPPPRLLRVTQDKRDDIFRCKDIKPEFVDKRNQADARRELYTLIDVVGAILHGAPEIQPGKRNADFKAIDDAAHRLLSALGNGHQSLLDSIGYVEGRAMDVDGAGARAHDLLSQIERDLVALRLMTNVDKLPTRGGRPPDLLRQRAIAECVQYWTKWSRHVASASAETPFWRFISAIFQYVGVDRANDLSRQIERALQDVT
jgi:hypothetical protein